MKIVASIQARLSSSRLPGKVLMELEGKPILQWQVERLSQSRLIDEVIVATTTNSADNKIENFCKKNHIKCFRGSENDVLERISNLINEYQADIHVECFGDSPLVDPQIVDEYINYLLNNMDEIDLVTNTIKTTYPPGSEVTVHKGSALTKANQIVNNNDPLREHVSLNIKSRPQIFSCTNIEAPQYLNHPELYIEIDTPEDLEVMQFIFSRMMQTVSKNFSLAEIINLMLANPDIAIINSKVSRRWKKFINHD